MGETEPKKIDPLSFWPSYRSAIEGLGGSNDAPREGYAFHSPYVYPREGMTTFQLQFRELAATRGKMAVRLLALHEAATKRKQIRKIDIDLSRLASQGGQIEVKFNAARGTAYALSGFVTEGADASASSLEMLIDRPGDAALFVERLETGRRTIFGSAPAKFWWSRRSDIAEMGLIDETPASLHGATSQMCTYRQFSEEPFLRWTSALHMDNTRHRKLWEFAYILQVLEEQGAIGPGSRGLGFGVGAEAIPALLASLGCEIVATDLASHESAAAGWVATGQHGDSLKSLERPQICGSEIFHERVSYRPVDMNAIPADLRDFDFCWSACAYEHLGSIAAGLRFVKRSIDCLKPGGVAVHTSELNLTSNSATVDNQPTVLFRRKDMERLALDLTRAGHRVLPIRYDQGDQPPDNYVDIPPYDGSSHLKLALQKYVTTSFGIAVIKNGG